MTEAGTSELELETAAVNVADRQIQDWLQGTNVYREGLNERRGETVSCLLAESDSIN